MNGDEQFSFLVGDDEDGKRLDRFAADRLAPLSRNRVKDLIKAGHAAIDAAPETSPNVKVRAGQAITLVVPEPEDATPQAEAIPLTIVFEDEHVVVVDKPAGMVVHPAAGNWTGTLVNALLHHCAGSLSGIGGVRRPGIVHRIDKDTSGLIVVAKHDAAHRVLTEQFAAHGADGALARAYDALVWGTPERPAGRIDAHLARAPHNRLKMAVVDQTVPGARWAATNFEVAEAFGTDGVVSLIRCVLETGRTHQIRVHMAHVGHPLLGDDVYGAGFRTRANVLPDASARAVRQLKRQALHARLLGFRHPESGETLRFETDLPDDLRSVLKALKSGK